MLASHVALGHLSINIPCVILQDKVRALSSHIPLHVQTNVVNQKFRGYSRAAGGLHNIHHSTLIIYRAPTVLLESCSLISHGLTWTRTI
jgi:hypothetical protein